MRLVVVALGWVAGLLLSGPALIWGGLALAALVVCALWWDDRRWAGIALLAFTLGGLRTTFVPTTSEVAAYNNSGGLSLEGRIVSAPDVRDDRVQFILAVDTVEQAGQVLPIDGRVLVRARRIAPVAYGDAVRVTGNLITPGEIDTFSYADYLARERVFSVMRNTAVEVLESGGGNPLFASLLDIKAQAQNHIVTMVPEPAAGLLTGILLGNERGISDALNADFAATGAAHIVAISGFNMVILAGAVMAVLRTTGVEGGPAAAIALGVIAVYTVFVGGGAAVVRAAVMSGVLIVGQSLKRETYVPASLAFVAVMMSALNPRVLGSVSFQLSFFATMGLALFADPFSRWLDAFLVRAYPKSIAGWLSTLLREPVAVTAAALVTTLPLTTLYFSRVSLVQIPVNLLIVPVQAAVLIVGLAATAIAFVYTPLAQVLYWFVMGLLAWTIGVVRFFANLPGAEVVYYADAEPVVAFMGVIIVGAILQASQPSWGLRLARVVRSRAVFGAMTLAAIVMAGLLVALARSRPDGNLHLWLLDVGDSNGVLVQTPRGAHILVDGGRFPARLLTQIGDRLPFNDREIEVVVVTQPDPIHYGALPAVLNRYRAGVVLSNGQPNLGDDFDALTAAVAPYPQHIVRAGDTLTTDDGVLLEVLNPQAQPELTDSLDTHAVVLRLTYGDVSFLLTGDLSTGGQAALLAAGEWPVASVMQLPGAGRARTLDFAFYDAAASQVLLLQTDAAGTGPNPDLLTSLGEVPLFSTAEHDGPVHLVTDGATVQVR